MAADLKSRTILLVEDEALTAMSEANMLRDYGFGVIHASSGKEAVKMAAGSSIDLILMDIDLGEGRMDDTESAMETLRQKELPIVFLTSHDEKEMVERVSRATVMYLKVPANSYL
jgi:CheY-like chemotaxis protein